MITKQCSKCRKNKNIEDFRKVKGYRDGIRSYCKECEKECSKEYRKNNPEKIKKYQRKYRKNNSIKAKKTIRKWVKSNLERRKKYEKRWRENNPEYNLEWKKNNYEKAKIIRDKSNKKRQSNPFLKLNNTISNAIRASLKNGKGGNHWEKLINYNLQELINHLERKFKQGMSWNNYGKKGWEIDHRKPISSFNFTSYKDKEFLECWSLSNLQPLWIEENRRKHNKIEYEIR